MDRKDFAAGDILFRAGDPGDFAYIIETGRIELMHVGKSFGVDAEESVAVLNPGDIFGEMALLAAAPREATARVTQAARLIRIESEQFVHRLRAAEPVIQFLLMTLLSGIRSQHKTVTTLELSALMLGSAERIAAVKDLTMEQEIKQALEQKDFEPFFQPIVRIQDSRIIGFEALVRWRHPHKNIISPQEFIPVAERSGAICEIDLMMLRKSWRALTPINADRRRRGLAPFFLSVNLSTNHFNQPGLGKRLKNIISEEKIDPSLIKFEITESGLIGQPDLAHHALNEIKNIGADISLDDFGTGYSSLSYLHSFPIDTIKIDRSFIKNLKVSEKSCTIVRTILQLAQTVGLNLVAEGIEDADTASLILALGCAHGQGYFYSPPVPVDDLPRLLLKDDGAIEALDARRVGGADLAHIPGGERRNFLNLSGPAVDRVQTVKG